MQKIKLALTFSPLLTAIVLVGCGGRTREQMNTQAHNDPHPYQTLLSLYKTQDGYIEPSEIVLPAGTNVEIDGVTAVVSGFSNCPPDGWYWGHPQAGDKCVVISKDNKLLQVLVYQKDGQLKQDKWSVVRIDGGIFLNDSSGAPVMRVSHE